MQLQSTIDNVPRQTANFYVYMLDACDYVHVQCECPGNDYAIFNHTGCTLAIFEMMESLKADTVNLY